MDIPDGGPSNELELDGRDIVLMSMKGGTEIGVQSDTHESRIFLTMDTTVVCYVMDRDAREAASAGRSSSYRFGTEKKWDCAYRLRHLTERPQGTRQIGGMAPRSGQNRGAAPRRDRPLQPEEMEYGSLQGGARRVRGAGHSSLG